MFREGDTAREQLAVGITGTFLHTSLSRRPGTEAQLDAGESWLVPIYERSGEMIYGQGQVEEPTETGQRGRVPAHRLTVSRHPGSGQEGAMGGSVSRIP